jgi:class 3 adenylate cyclase
MLVSGDDYLEIYLSPEISDLVAEFVSGQAAPEVPDGVLATVMFTDLVASTRSAASLGDRAWRDLLARHHAVVRRELGRFRGEERDTAGDGFFATFDGPARAIRCGQAIVAGLEPLGLEIRIGIHIGECEVHESKLAGLAVVIGARISAEAGSGEVLVSGNGQRPGRRIRPRILRPRPAPPERRPGRVAALRGGVTARRRPDWRIL